MTDHHEPRVGELDAKALTLAVYAIMELNPDVSFTNRAQTAIRAYLAALPASVGDAGLVERNLKLIKDRVCGDAQPRWHNDLVTTSSRSIIADLADAALAALSRPAVEPVAVKALEWSEGPFDPRTSNSKEFWIGAGSFTRYVIGHYLLGDKHRECWLVVAPFALGIEFPTLDAAKAAAQADYETRIRSALTAPPVQPKADAASDAICVRCASQQEGPVPTECTCGLHPQAEQADLVERVAEILMTHPLVDAPRRMAENFRELARTVVAALQKQER